MPQMGVSVAEGTVVEWKKQVGDWVEADEVIAAISTDKIDTDVEAPAAGRLQEILVAGRRDGRGRHRAGADRDRRQAGRAALVRGHERGRGRARGARRGRASCRATRPTPTRQRLGAGGRAPARPGGRRYSPVVMRMAAEHDLDLERIEGTGRGGRVRKQDVLAYLEERRRRRRGRAADAHRVALQARRAGRRRSSARRGFGAAEPASRAGAGGHRAALAHARSRSGGRWSSRCRPRRRARRSSRPT